MANRVIEAAGLNEFNQALKNSLSPSEQHNGLSKENLAKELRRIQNYTNLRGVAGTPKRRNALVNEMAEARRLAGLGVNMNYYRNQRRRGAATGTLRQVNEGYSMFQGFGNQARRAAPAPRVAHAEEVVLGYEENMPRNNRDAIERLYAAIRAQGIPLENANARVPNNRGPNIPKPKTKKNRKSRRRN